MIDLISLQNVFYPPIGIAHISSDISDLVLPRLDGKERIIINCSSQPNSHPHLGSVTTFMTAFAIGRHLKEKLRLDVSLVFDQLENAPGKKEMINEVEYQLSLANVRLNGQSLADKYIQTFKKIFDELSSLSSIPYSIKSYQEFQSQSFFRAAILRIFKDKEKFEKILSPYEKHLRLRFPCPECHYVDKPSRNTKLIEQTNDELIFESYCFEHGKFYSVVRVDNNTYFDTNTPLRSVAKGVQLVEEGRESNSLVVMVDGGDWSGVWALNIFAYGLSELGYKVADFPMRYFAPIIVDWSGAKFSKSLYLKSNAYKYLPQGLIDFSKFEEMYGHEGFLILWNEVCDWVRSPKKLFRNYSVDYFKLLLEKNIRS